MAIIAVVPGTGKMGSGFAHRFAKHGHKVLLLSRDSNKAKAVAADIQSQFPNADILAGGKDELPLHTVCISQCILYYVG